MIHKELNRKIQIEHHEPHNVFYTLDSKQPTHHEPHNVFYTLDSKQPYTSCIWVFIIL